MSGKALLEALLFFGVPLSSLKLSVMLHLLLEYQDQVQMHNFECSTRALRPVNTNTILFIVSQLLLID